MLNKLELVPKEDLPEWEKQDYMNMYDFEIRLSKGEVNLCDNNGKKFIGNTQQFARKELLKSRHLFTHDVWFCDDCQASFDNIKDAVIHHSDRKHIVIEYINKKVTDVFIPPHLHDDVNIKN